MSAEFEKIVLEKFDELNSKIDTNTESINNLSKELHETKEKVEQLDNKVEQLDNKVMQLDSKVVQLDNEVKQQGLNFAKFENDFNIKIQGLFDSFVANTESHLAYDKFISALNAKTYNQDIRISVLEDNFKNAKLLANS